jgi:hypothetical protein
MPTFMLVPQTERFPPNIDLICRANSVSCHFQQYISYIVVSGSVLLLEETGVPGENH